MAVSFFQKPKPLLALAWFLAINGIASARPWTNTEGKSIEAEYLSHTATEVVLAINGKPVTIAIDKLAETDRNYLAALVPAATPAATAPAATGGRYSLKFTTHLFPKQTDYYLDTLRKSVLTAFEAGTAGETAAGKSDAWLKRNPDKDTYQLYVPPSYDGTQPYGLLLLINAVDPGGIPEEWRPMLDEMKLIAVCAENIGNSQPMLRRVQWSMDALANAEKEYRINPTRRFVVGTLGGGPAAMLTAAMYPGHFAGALALGAEIKPPTNGTGSNFPGLTAPDFKSPQHSHMRWAVLSGSGVRTHDKITASGKEWEALIDLPDATVPPTANQMKQAVTWLETGK
jgi:hypothetical protein